jgi:hypothetical protein
VQRAAADLDGLGDTIERYLDDGRGPQLQAVGVTDVGSFTAFYWREQLGTAGMVFLLTTVGGLIGGGLYGVFRPKPEVSQPGRVPGSA